MVIRTTNNKDILINPLQVVEVEEQKPNEVYSVELSTNVTIRITKASYIKLLTWFSKYEKSLIERYSRR